MGSDALGEYMSKWFFSDTKIGHEIDIFTALQANNKCQFLVLLHSNQIFGMTKVTSSTFNQHKTVLPTLFCISKQCVHK